MPTASDYRTAANIARLSHGTILPAAAAEWDRKAEKLEAREAYAVALYRTGFGPSQSALSGGTRIVSKLIEDGWTPPEGLFDGPS